MPEPVIRAFSGDDYSKNAARVGDKAPCVVCGKAVTTPHPKMVRVSTDNTIHAVAADLGERDMGCFPVGASCLRQHAELKALASCF